MTSLLRPPVKASSPPAASWTSLIATTLGLDDFGRLRVRVRAKVGALQGHRLVVQCYSPDQVKGGLPGLYERPLSAAQRAVEGEELERGVEMVLVHSCAGRSDQGCVVIAWIEAGAPDLDYDGLTARPGGAVFVGSGFADAQSAQLVLEPSAA